MKRVKPHTRSVTTVRIDDDNEVELEYAPVDDVVIAHVGPDKVALAYLVHDHTPSGLDEMCDGRVLTLRDSPMECSAAAQNDPDAVVLDCYEHGGVAWSIHGEGRQCRFDTAKGVGLWIPDSEYRKEIHEAAAAAMEDPQDRFIAACRVFLEEYNARVNGEVYGLVIEHFERDDNNHGYERAFTDEAWDIAGYEAAQAELLSSLPKSIYPETV